MVRALELRLIEAAQGSMAAGQEAWPGRESLGQWVREYEGQWDGILSHVVIGWSDGSSYTGACQNGKKTWPRCVKLA